ncbi:MAG: metallophosphoesterase [Bacteroidales bacterium]
MRNIQFLIFFSTVITVFSLLSWYVYSKGIQAFPAGSPYRSWFRYIFLFLSASYIAARFIEKIWLSIGSDILMWIGSFWLAAFFYFLITALLIDIVRLANFAVPFLPEYTSTLIFKQRLFKVVAGITAILILAGYMNSIIPRVKKLDLVIDKKVEGMEELTIAFASDIHLGTLIGPRRTNQIVNKLNALNADMILLGGDIVDEDLAPVIRSNLGDSLKKLHAPLGVIGITGNHEFIGGAEEAVRYLEDNGIMIIRDKALLVDNKFYVVGREDRDKPRFSGLERKRIEEIISDVDFLKPVILLDHQPFELDEKEKAGIDLTLSGHTHHGQLWPLNYLTGAIYEVSWGYKRKGNTHIYVSSGVGGWGPPVRIGNRPEVVLIHIRFKPDPSL